MREVGNNFPKPSEVCRVEIKKKEKRKIKKGKKHDNF